MIDLHCKILNCEKVSERKGYCSRHAKLVLDEGELPENLARCGTYHNQCPMYGFFDGGNACSLIAGHAGVHEGYWGTRHERWGTGDEVGAFIAARYRYVRKWR